MSQQKKVTWKRIPDGGWLQGKPGYELHKDGKDYFIAQDYDEEDGESQKLMWFLHDNMHGFIQAFDTLRAAKEWIAS